VLLGVNRGCPYDISDEFLIFGAHTGAELWSLLMFFAVYPTSLSGKLPLGATVPCRWFNTVASERMSALGQKQTFAVQNGMSALTPKADMCGEKRHVRFVPIADIDVIR
jgi:hypothetical protein